MHEELPQFSDVQAAMQRIAPYVHHTPVMQSSHLSKVLGMTVMFKCENLQKVGAFKARGACNAVFALDAKQVASGVVTHSSGNHAAALARAAALRGAPAYVVMPTNAPEVKKTAVRGFGGQIVECEPTLIAREREAKALMDKTGATLVHPYDDVWVIAGQGTAVLEMVDQCEQPEVYLAPVGGGGLLTGSALSVRALWPGTRVIGVEPLGADDAARGFRAGERVCGASPKTIADGLRGELSARTFSLMRRDVDEVLTVSEASIIEAMRLIWHHLKIVIEPSAAVPVAALLEGQVKADRAAVLLSGGNVDFSLLSSWFG